LVWVGLGWFLAGLVKSTPLTKLFRAELEGERREWGESEGGLRFSLLTPDE